MADARAQKVKQYLSEHPTAKTSEIQHATGASRSFASRLAKEHRDSLAKIVGTEVTDDTPTVKVAAVTVPVPEKLTLSQRVFGNINAAKVDKPKTKPKAPVKADLVSTVLPTMLAGFIATYAQDLLPSGYRQCAPSKDEVAGIIGPLFAILNRHVQVFAKADADTVDLINALVAGMAYGTRSYILYNKIKHDNESKGKPLDVKRSEPPINYEQYAIPEPDGEPTLVRGLRAYQAASGGTGGPGNDLPQNTTNADDNKGNAWLNVTPGTDDTEQLRRYEAEAASRLLKSDALGRARLGLYG